MCCPVSSSRHHEMAVTQFSFDEVPRGICSTENSFLNKYSPDKIASNINPPTAESSSGQNTFKLQNDNPRLIRKPDVLQTVAANVTEALYPFQPQ